MLIFKNSKIEVKEKDESIVIKYKKPHKIIIPKSDKKWIDIEIVRLNKIKQLNNKKFVYQETMGEMFSVSRQMINRRIMVEKKEGIISLLQGDWGKSKLTDSVEKRITEMICENVFLNANQIKEDLIREGTVNNISSGSIYNGIQNMNGQYVIKLLRKKSEKSKPEIHMSSKYIIDRLMKIVTDLLEMITTKNFNKLKTNENDIKNILENYKPISKSNKTNEKKQWDCYSPRKKLKRDIKRKNNCLRMIFDFLFKKTICCPDCLSENITFLFARERYPLNENGERYTDISRIYSCNNKGCETKWFTLTPKDVELYAHANTKLKEKAFGLLFHVRGTYRRVSDYLKSINIPVNFTTLMRWVKKAGEEYIDTLKLQDKIFAQTICIDEKWVKIRNLWRYVFVAVDNLADDLLDAELHLNNGIKEIKLFLLKLKSMGIYPKVIITDLLKGYGKIIKEIFPLAYHHECILHAGRAARRLVYKYFQGEVYKELRKKLIKKICWFFKSEDKSTVNKRWKKLQLLKDKYGQAIIPMLKLLERYKPKFIYSLEHPEIPKTSNGAERVIKELNTKYQNMFGFSSFYVAQFMLKVFVIYYRMKKFSSGRFKGNSPVEVKNLLLGKSKWTDILFAHFS